MATRTRRLLRSGHGVDAFLVGCGVLSVGAYLWVVAHRIFYPYELQWMEGGSVELVHRLVHGHTLYTSPTLRFTPWPYPPLYFALSAGVAKVVGVGFVPLRLVSTAASLGVLALIFVLVHQETGNVAAAVFSAGVYASTFRLAGAWFDIGRVDSLWLLLCLSAIVVARRARSWRAGAVVGLLLFLACFTKQDGLVVAVPLIAWLFAVRRRAAVAALSSLVLLLGASTVALNAATRGWYGYFVVHELLGQPITRSQVTDFWLHDILTPLPVVGMLAVGAVLAGRRSDELVWTSRGAVLAGGAGLVAAAWAGRLHSGGYANVLMPAYAAMAVLAGVGVAYLREVSRALRARTRIVASACVVVALVTQFAHVAYPVSAQIPTRADARAGDGFVRMLRHLPGKVVVLIHPWYATHAGKGDFAAGVAIQDLLRSQPGAARSALIRDESRALLAPDIGAVVLDQAPDPFLAPQLAMAYRRLPGPAIPGTAFFPVTDLRLRPTFVYIRVRDGQMP